ncbi:MAG: NUDIX domain-containing protein [Oscillospiraceae bacterium]|nr:NUDIX domain-containing protein [Oscillospiraceae bacterium]
MSRSDKDEMLLVLDENGNSTGKVKHRQYIHENGIFHNEVACIVINNKKEILLQKRSENKKSYPGCWALCAGHVVGYEPIKNAILTEINEELVMEVKEKNIFQLIPKMKNERDDNRCYVTCFCAIINKKADDFLIQKDEVEEIKWHSLEEFEEMIKKEEGTIFKNNDYYKAIVNALRDIFSNPEISKIYATFLEQIEELDEQGKATGKLITREFAHNFGVWHKSVSLFILDEDDRVLLQKRGKSKIRNAELWDVSASGHVLFGETDLNTLLREAKEETDLEVAKEDVKFLLTYKESISFNKMFNDNTIFNVYITKLDTSEPKVKAENFEVEELKFFDISEVKEMMKDYELLAYRPEAFEALVKYLSKE